LTPSGRAIKTGNVLFRYRGQIPVFLYLCVLILIFLLDHDPVPGAEWRIFFYLLVSLAGLLIRIDSVGHAAPQTSGRNREKQVAGELNTSGWYSIFRHPLYIANFLLYLGPVLVTEDPVIIIPFIFIVSIYYKLISLAEDDFLKNKFGDVHAEWAEKTPGFIPVFSHYKPPIYPFSWSRILMNEYHILIEIPVAFLAVTAVKNFSSFGTWHPGLFWILTLPVCFLMWLVLQIRHKREKQKWRKNQVS